MTIESALHAIFTRRLPSKYNSAYVRWRNGTLGIEAKLKVLADFGYKVEIDVTPPETDSTLFLTDTDRKPAMRTFRKSKTGPGKGDLP